MDLARRAPAPHSLEGASVTLGGHRVEEDVVLAQFAVRLAVRLQHSVYDLADGVWPGDLDDLLQRPRRGVRRPRLLVVGVAEADRQRRGRAGRRRGKGR